MSCEANDKYTFRYLKKFEPAVLFVVVSYQSRAASLSEPLDTGSPVSVKYLAFHFYES
jgi:hypothetical protein